MPKRKSQAHATSTAAAIDSGDESHTSATIAGRVAAKSTHMQLAKRMKARGPSPYPSAIAANVSAIAGELHVGSSSG
jgi:hypothetical protein